MFSQQTVEGHRNKGFPIKLQVLELSKVGILVSVCFGTYLGEVTSQHRRVSKRLGFSKQMAILGNVYADSAETLPGLMDIFFLETPPPMGPCRFNYCHLHDKLARMKWATSNGIDCEKASSLRGPQDTVRTARITNRTFTILAISQIINYRHRASLELFKVSHLNFESLCSVRKCKILT